MAKKTRVTNSSVKSFTKKGNAAPGTLGSGKLARLGHFDPTTGFVYQHPRIKQDPISNGPNTRVTNPAASTHAAHERTRSLGMGGVGSVGRNSDVGAPAED